MALDSRPPETVRRVAKGMKQRRLSDRNKFRRIIGGDTRPRGFGRLLGKDSAGKPASLPANYSFKTTFRENGLVCVEIGLNKSRMGKKVLQWSGDKHTLVSDVFSAVRIPVHIQERLVDARHERDQVLEKVEGLNAFLNKKGHLLTPLGFNMRARLMQKVKKKLEDSIVPLKREALMMLEKAEKSLLEAGVESTEFGKRRQVSIACVQLTAFRDRLGKHRDKEVEEILAFNKKREALIRGERDRRIESQLRKWVTIYSNRNRWAIRGKDQKDLNYAERILELASSNMRIVKKMEVIGELRKEMAGKKYKVAGKRFNLSHLDNARAAYGRGDQKSREDARKLLKKGALLLVLGKPQFVAGALEKCEPYLKGVAEKIREGAEHMDNVTEFLAGPEQRKDAGGELDSAVVCFHTALRKMEIVNRA
ncbi:MAG: hypothetical protein GY852_01955 [bacterium]|nr:hypothetical protein [bacterium]